MMRFAKILCCGIALLLICSAALASGGAQKAYDEARDQYQKLLHTAKKQKYRENWTRVIDQFLKVLELDPSHARASDALFMAGKTAQGLYGISRSPRDARLAVDYFDQLAKGYASSSLADDGLFHAAQILEQHLGETPGALERYHQLVEIFPKGDMVQEAQARVAALAPIHHAEPLTVPEEVVVMAGPNEVEGVRFTGEDGHTRVVIDLKRSAGFVYNLLAGDADAGTHPRLFVDIEGVGLEKGISSKIEVQRGVLTRVRAGMFKPDVVRVVLDLEKDVDYKVFSLEGPNRIVIDLADQGATNQHPQPSLKGDGIADVLERAPQRAPLKVQVPQITQARKALRIVLDPGHGGKDPGAVGRNGVLEKDVTLATAKILGPKLRSALGCEVIYTRTTDVYLTLDERTAIANEAEADFFISLHANASPNPRAYGIETYYLNFSKNDQAMEVAARENGTSLKEVGDLEMILLDLMANAKINESSRLASEIQKALVGKLRGHYSKVRDLGVRQGPFYVLLGASMPSVLVETAFVSNQREERRLNSRKYQEKTAEAIVSAMQNYVKSVRRVASR